jgi:5-methylthioadenosine/S-adenosylhomocysteine deaminase
VLVLARWVLPVASPPVSRGAVRVEGGRIAAVGPAAAPGREGLAASPGERVVDLGDSAILPGLVDAHAHLEWTALRGLLDGVPLTRWPIVFPRVRAVWRPDDYLASARLGALETLEAGITTVAESGPTGAGLAAMQEAGLGGRASVEVLGPDPESWETHADAAERQVARLESQRGETRRIAIGLAPHALHTVSAPLLRWCRRFADAKGLPLSLHLAESAAEVRFLEHGDGPWAETYARAGVRAAWPGRPPVAAAHEAGLLVRGTIVAHCVHARADDLAVLARTGAGIACCPRSNAGLGVGVAPLARLLAGDLPVGFGTDSGASVGAKDLFAEARAARLLARTASGDPAAPAGASRLLSALTLGGARALGLEADIGSLQPGKRADLVAVALGRPHLRPADDVEAALVAAAGHHDVTWVMVEGEVKVEAGVARLAGRDALLAAADGIGERTRAALAP